MGKTQEDSWVFSSGGFCAARDKRVCWSVTVESIGDEMRVGFTTDPLTLLKRETRTLRQPAAYLYSDGSKVRGVFAGGRRVSKESVQPFGTGSRVAVQLDFERDRARSTHRHHSHLRPDRNRGLRRADAGDIQNARDR